MSSSPPHDRTSGAMELTRLLPLGWAVLFVLVAGVLACIEAALSRVSRVRVEELVRGERPGALRLQAVLADPPALAEPAAAAPPGLRAGGHGHRRRVRPAPDRRARGRSSAPSPG
jgi:hypothetical protein